jgi:predicted MFS family arabinose efflux permease
MDRSRLFPILFFAAFLCLGVLLATQWRDLQESFSLNTTIPLNKLSKAVRGTDGTFAVVFHSNKRIARLDAKGNLLYLLFPNSSAEQGFSFANEISLAPDGRLYVVSTYIDPESLTVNREAIVRYSPKGRYEGIVFSIDHNADDYVDNIGLIRGLMWTPEGLRFCRAKDQAIRCTLLDPTKGTVISETQTPTNQSSEQILYAAIAHDGEQLAFTTASTEIFIARPGEVPVKQYDGRDIEELSIPSDIHFSNRALYFSDLGRDAVMRLSTNDGKVTAVFDAAIAGKRGYNDAFFECKSFQIDTTELTLTNNGKIVFFNTENRQPILVLAQARGDLLFWLKRIALWLQLLLFTGIGLILIRLIISSATPEGLQSSRRTAMVALMVCAAVGITAFMIFNNLNLRLAEEIRLNLRGFLEVGRLVIDSEAVDRIDHVQDYMNSDYTALLTQLRQTITRDNAIAASTYAGIYKIYGNKLVALAYHDGLRGIFYPYEYQYDQSVYATIAASGRTYIGQMADMYGVWLIGVHPLHNRLGELVGFLEVGLDQSAHKEANWTLLKSTLVNLAMILFVLLFVFSEASFFTSRIIDKHRLAQADKLWQYDEGALRFLSFLGLTGVFLSASFLPLYSKSLAGPMEPLPLHMVIGLPMVVETLTGAITAMLYGHVRIRLGLKHDIILGSLVIAAGMAVTAQTSTFFGLILGRATVGLGMGLLMIALRTFFLIDKDEERQNSGIIALTVGVTAGINVGSVSGGMLADLFGMERIFWVQAVLLTLTALCAQILLRNRWRPPPSDDTLFSLPAFLRERTVFAFFFLAFLPITACGFFLGFLFPLFAESKGLSPNEISLAFMLFGIASVYMGPSLTHLTSFLFGTRGAIVAGALVMVCALLCFAAFQNLAAAYVTVILFGLTDSFIFNQGIAYFTALPSVQQLGEDKAMGVYSVFESSGEALGPMAFGLAMSMSLGAGVSAIAVLLAAGTGMFFLLSRPPHREQV